MTPKPLSLPFSRRALLKGSAATLAAATLPSWLEKVRAEKVEYQRTHNLIVVLSSGGWDTTYVLDPKPGLRTIDAPDGKIKMFGELPIFTHASRPAVSDFFGRFGQRVAVINGLQVRSFVHPDCMKRMLTGTASETAADLCAQTAAFSERGESTPVPYLALGAQARSGQYASLTGRIGTTNQLSALVDPLGAYAARGSRLPDVGLGLSKEEEALVQKKLRASVSRQSMWGSEYVYRQDFQDSLTRANALREFIAKNGIGQRTYTLDLSTQIPLAVRALRENFSRSVLLQTDNWDTHQDNARQSQLNESLFASLGTLISALEADDLLDDTVVVVMSEMGRTPKLNGDEGKDHWPVTSAMLLGPNIRGGRAYGATSDKLEDLPIDYATGRPSTKGKHLEAPNFVAGALFSAGVFGDDQSPMADVSSFLAYRST